MADTPPTSPLSQSSNQNKIVSTLQETFFPHSLQPVDVPRCGRGVEVTLASHVSCIHPQGDNNHAASSNSFAHER